MLTIYYSETIIALSNRDNKQQGNDMLQAQLNQQALSHFPNIQNIMMVADKNTANQMHCYTIAKCMNSVTPISELDDIELAKVEDLIIDCFRFNGWVI